MASLSQPRENSKFDRIQCNLSRKRYCNNSRIGLDFYPGIIPCTFLLYSFENESSFRKNAEALKTIFLHAFTLKKAFKIMKFRYKILYTTCMCYIQTRCRLFTLYSLLFSLMRYYLLFTRIITHLHLTQSHKKTIVFCFQKKQHVVTFRGFLLLFSSTFSMLVLPYRLGHRGRRLLALSFCLFYK